MIVYTAVLLVAAQPVPVPPAPPLMVSAPVAVPPAPSVAVSADALAAGTELATLLNSETVTLRQSRKMFDVTMPNVLAGNPEFKVLETAYPGATVAVLAAMRPVIERHVIARLPLLWGRLGRAYATALTKAEIQELLAFYRSPTGTWLIGKITDGTDLTQLLKTQIDDPDHKVSGKDISAAVVKPAVRALADDITPERARELVRLGTRPAGLKLNALNPQLAQIAATWGNEPDPAAEAEVQAVVKATIEGFVARADAVRTPTDA